MKNKLVIGIGILAFLTLGYALGKSTPAENKIAGTNTAHSSAEMPDTSSVYGHVHATVYIPETKKLLIGSHNGLFESADGGISFIKVKVKGQVPASDFMSLVMDPRNHQVLFAGGHDLGVVKSIDGGITWQKSDTGITGSDIHGLTVNQKNPDSLFAYSVGNGVFRSQDNGRTWKRMDDGPDNPSVRSFGYLAVQTQMDKSMGWDNWGILMAGTGGGLYQSFSCFCGWTKTTSAFDNTTLYSLANIESDLRTIYAATQNGILKSEDEGKTWKVKSAGLTGLPIAAISINPLNPKELFAVSESGQVFRSEDKGEVWQLR